jgi:hypothetical protein
MSHVNGGTRGFYFVPYHDKWYDNFDLFNLFDLIFFSSEAAEALRAMNRANCGVFSIILDLE